MKKIHIDKEYEAPVLGYHYWRKIYKKRTTGGRNRSTCTNCLSKIRCHDHIIRDKR